MPFPFSLFTWTNGRSIPTLARLNRAFVNPNLATSFPSTSLTTLACSTSDHKLLLLYFSTIVPKIRLFCFKNAWLRNSCFLPAVLPSWLARDMCTDAAGNLAYKLKRVQHASENLARLHRTPPTLIANYKFVVLFLDSTEELLCLSP